MNAALLLAGLLSAPATVNVDITDTLATLGPLFFSSGDEMTEKLPWAARAPVSDTKPALLRWGGIAAEYYDWEADNYDGYFWIDFWDTATIFPIPVKWGTDSLLRFCEAYNIEPLLTVNCQLNDPGKAARWVEYCNGDTTTPMGLLRAQRGHPAPYNVQYWSIGNEPDIAGWVFPAGPLGWTFYRHFGIPFASWQQSDSLFWTKGDFAQLAQAYIDTMRATSPVPLQIVGLSLAGDTTWIDSVLPAIASRTDLVDMHYYPVWDSVSDTARYRQWLSWLDTGGPSTLPLEAEIDGWRANIAARDSGYGVELAILEFNCGFVFPPDDYWWDYVDMLLLADAYGHMMRKGLPIAASYSIYQDGDSLNYPMFGIVRDTTCRRAASHMLQLFAEHWGKEVVSCSSDAALNGEGLEAYASLDPDTLRIFVINKSPADTFDAALTWPGWGPCGQAHIYELSNDRAVGPPDCGSSGYRDLGLFNTVVGGMNYSFPPYTVTMVELPLGTAVSEGGAVKWPNARLALNPSRDGVVLTFTAPLPADARVKMYDVAGRLVGDETAPKGAKSFAAGEGLPAGVYWVSFNGKRMKALVVE